MQGEFQFNKKNKVKILLHLKNISGAITNRRQSKNSVNNKRDRTLQSLLIMSIIYIATYFLAVFILVFVKFENITCWSTKIFF